MIAYLDASALVPLLVSDKHTAAARRLVQNAEPVISRWTAAEVTSALNRLIRIGRIGAQDAARAEEAVDEMLATTSVIELAAGDAALARHLLRQVAAPLRAADALHLAIAVRLDRPLASFDETLRAAALEVGVVTLPT